MFLGQTVWAQSLDFIQGYKFDVSGGFYYSNENLGELLLINHSDSIEGFELEFQPDSLIQTTLFLKDGLEFIEGAALKILLWI